MNCIYKFIYYNQWYHYKKHNAMINDVIVQLEFFLNYNCQVNKYYLKKIIKNYFKKIQ